MDGPHTLSRRAWLAGAAAPLLTATRGSAAVPVSDSPAPWTYAVDGRVETGALGLTLTHEHLLVDFVGAAAASRARYDADEVVRVCLPHLKALRAAGCETLVECTPAYIGRDPALLRQLSAASGVRILTNTGYYGAADDKFVPDHARRETAEELATRWTKELEDGIEGTGIRPGFLKTGIDAGPLSPLDRKLVHAAALCHRRTGLTIAVHSGDGTAALEMLATLADEGVAPEAAIWVHAQNEKDRTRHVDAARRGAWISFDGIGADSLEGHAVAVREMEERGLLGHVLVSQDAGWYHVGEPGGGTFRGFTFLLESFVPRLRALGTSAAAVRTLLVENPARAFAIRPRLRG